MSRERLDVMRSSRTLILAASIVLIVKGPSGDRERRCANRKTALSFPIVRGSEEPGH